MSQTMIIGVAGLSLFALGLCTLTVATLATPPLEPPKFGIRGLKRKHAIQQGGLFALFEPLIRFFARVSSRLPIEPSRRRIDIMLVQAGDPIGVTPDEFLSMSGLAGVLAALVAALMADFAALPAAVAVFAAALGAGVPYFRISGQAQLRARQVNRSLPTAIDLVALAMGAGLDFPGAIREMIDNGLDREEPLHEEFLRLLQSLELGHTRKEALEAFAMRVPTTPVQEFVAAVVQAEEKGNPLSNVLVTQAEVLRTKRSVAAEESASRAGVMMMVPLLLIFCSIILILLGPFLLQGMTTGF